MFLFTNTLPNDITYVVVLPIYFGICWMLEVELRVASSNRDYNNKILPSKCLPYNFNPIKKYSHNDIN